MEEQKNNKLQINLILFGIVFTTLLFVVVLFLTKNRANDDYNEVSNQSELSPTIQKISNISPSLSPTSVLDEEKKGKLSFKSTNNIVNLNTPFSVIIQANSANEQVVGMDILVKYDSSKLKVKNIISLNNNFSVYSSQEKDILILTLVKKINSKQPVYFNNNDLIKIDFQPIQKGNVSLEIIPMYNKFKTTLINDQNEVFTPVLENNLFQIIVE